MRLSFFKRQIKITSILLINTVVVTGISLLLVCYLWITQEKESFEKEAETIRTEYVNFQKSFLKREVEHVLRYLQYNRNQIEERLKRNLKTKVYEAHGIVLGIWNANKDTKSRDEIISMIRDALEGVRFFDGRGYFFATALDGLVVLFGDRPEEVGKSYWDYSDKSGLFISREMTKIVSQQEEGYLRYMMSKPHSEGNSHPKMAFVKIFKPLNFYIGTGEYMEDFEEVVKQDALKLIHTLEYGGSGYVFVGQWDGVSLSGPARGKNMMDVTDNNGLKIVQELIKVSQNGGGFVSYVMPALDGKKNALKMSYAQGFDDWKWYIGAGKYIDEIDLVIEEKKAVLAKRIQEKIIVIVVVLILGLLTIISLVKLLSSRINRNLEAIIGFFETSSTTFVPIDLQRLYFPEFTKLGRAANRMVEERNRAEAALKESEAQLKVILSSVRIGIMIIDPETYNIVEVNPHAVEMIGLPQNEIIGSHCTKLICPHVKGRCPGGEFSLSDHTKEVMLLTEGGAKEIPILKSFAKIQLNGKEHYLESFIDISDVKAREKEIKALKNHLKNIIDSISSAIFAVDVEGYVSQYNDATEEITGTSLGGEERVSWKTLLAPFAVEESEVEAAIAQNRSYRKERIERLNGDRRQYFDLTVYPLSTEPISGVVVRIDDITERIRLSELLIQTEKMMSVGGLAAGMAHEINNPLAAILQGVQVLEMRLGEQSSTIRTVAERTGSSETEIYGLLEENKIPRMIQAIKESGLRAAKIVSNMLSFSRKSDPVVSQHDIAALMEQTLELAANDYDLKNQLDFKKVVIEKDYEPNIPAIDCEASQIQQVFLNILKNAAHAMVVTAEQRPPRLNLRIRKQYQSIVVEIEDNGPGMDEAIKKRVFEPFFTTKSGNLGTGLGLSVSYFIITENHGGSISVESIPGKGSRFAITLPVGNPH